MTSKSPRDAALFVGPLVTLAAVGIILIAAHFYDASPVKLRPCGFLNHTGIPCPGCGGTRAMQALSHGHVATALSWHPFFTLFAFFSPLWVGFAVWQYRSGKTMPPPRKHNRHLLIGLISVLVLLGINWVYLILTLP